MPIIETPERLSEKCAIEKAKRKGVGRPKGGNLVNNMLLNMKKKDVESVMKAILEAASDPDHKNFPQASKMLMDRLAHTSNYEKKSQNSVPQININIGDTDKAISIDGEVVSE